MENTHIKLSDRLLALSLALLVTGCSSKPSPEELQMAAIPGMDEFWAGSRNYPPRHRVKIAPFLISTCETTQGSYASVIGSNPSMGEHAPDLPVQNVTWMQAAKYCNELSRLRGREPCYRETAVGGLECDPSRNGFRLPTSAEWELACRGQGETPYFWGDRRDEAYCVPPLAPRSFDLVQRHRLVSFTKPVRSRQANAYGLHDMAGNVSEWCQDSLEGRPRFRVIRGGSWGDHDWAAFETKWASAMPRDDASPTVGFRIVRREV